MLKIMHLDLLLLVFFLQQGGAGRTVPLSFRRVRYAHAAIVEPLVLALEERGRERELRLAFVNYESFGDENLNRVN